MPSEISSTQYATRRKELLALVNQLRAVGAQSDLDLPRITVIGNQSAGKSSVVEAISGIKVPRDAGTCTRCPMECRLSSSSSPWSCRIFIRREYDKFGKPLDDVSETSFGNIITDKTKVEPMLRRAQVSVLNPEVPVARILSSTFDELKEWSEKSLETVPFSRNVIIVDLEGPGLTDLAFIDLPGLIQNAEADIVKLVEEMVSSHIKGNCLILVALPMTDDIENQKALRLARLEDPDGRRTIGVLTKPDMLGVGSTKALSLWLDVIEGRSRHQLTHGYYCTRQPDDAERSNPATAAKARETEIAFFRNTLPWSKSSHTDRFGTDNLTNNLSRLLVRIIDDSLPVIRSEAASLLEATCEELNRLPKALEEEPATHMLNLISAFAGQVQQYVKGGVHLTQLIHEHRDAYKDLKIAIRRTAPNFVPCLPKESRPAFPNCLEEEEDDLDGLTMSNEKRTFNLADMRLHISNSITRELPNNVPFEAKVALITNFQTTWPSAAEKCFSSVEKATMRLLLKMIDENFGRFDMLRANIRSLVYELVAKHRSSCQLFLDTALEAEVTPYTQNTPYLATGTDKWLSKYKSIRAEESVESGKTTSVDGVSVRPAIQKPTPQVKQNGTQVNGTAPSTPPTPAGFGTPIPFPFRKPDGTDSAKTSATTSQGASPFAPSSKDSSAAKAPSAIPNGVPAFDFSKPSTGGSSQTVPFWERPVATPPSSQSLASDVPTQLNSAGITLGNVTPATAGSGPSQEDVNDLLAALARCGFTGLTLEDLGKLHATDEYETELQVMAEVRGYFQVAYKRIIDNIPSFIDLRFVKALSKELQPFLITKFGLGNSSASERCAQYLAEDPVVVERRDELLARKTRLDKVQQELISFGLGELATG
ncbi:hypothetical protein D9758_018043 [Tetrapyrgos nigripes]|uniref:Uncharacterized protein n=1 Tax=Tetrapyrgos nigripes TaxID=182062 RepID=A0A8H5B6H6_9AGAR|nr:hypothetical protein D9758_018043 [Tetrapyrgos nigripes]